MTKCTMFFFCWDNGAFGIFVVTFMSLTLLLLSVVKLNFYVFAPIYPQTDTLREKLQSTEEHADDRKCRRI